MVLPSSSILAKLPQELIDLILDCLDDDPNTLRACANVCRSSRRRSQVLLFSHHKRISFYQPCNTLSASDRSWYPYSLGSFDPELPPPIFTLHDYHSKIADYAHLACWIREVTVAYDTLYFLWGTNGQLLIRVLAHFPRLEWLTVTYSSTQEPSLQQFKYNSISTTTFFSVRVALASVFATAPIRHITLRGVEINPYHLSSCKRLRHMDLKGLTDFAPGSAPLPLLDSERPRLESLRVDFGSRAFHSLVRYCADPDPPFILSDIRKFATRESASWKVDFQHVLRHFKGLMGLELALTILDGDANEAEWVDLSPLSKLSTLSLHLQTTRGKYKATRNQIQAFTRRCARILANLPQSSQITQVTFTFGYDSEAVFGPWETRSLSIPMYHRYTPLRGFQKNQQYDWYDVDSTLTFLAPEKLDRVDFRIGSCWTTFNDLKETLPKVKADGKIKVEVDYTEEIEQVHW